MSAAPVTTVLVTGANGFIGRAAAPALAAAGLAVRRGMRAPDDAPDSVGFDLDDASTLAPALRGCQAALYLVHGLKRGGDYAQWEERAAHTFMAACAAQSVARVVYLGGPDPGALGSTHLRARLRTGAILRERGAALGVEVVELRAAVIIGAASDSFRLARDVARRVPVVLAAPWLDTRQQPVAIDDMIRALVLALAAPAGVYDVPGPEVVSGLDVMRKLKRLCGLPEWVVSTRADGRDVAGRVIGALTRVHPLLARELVMGMGGGDLIATGVSIWERDPLHVRLSVEDALRRALAADDPGLVANVFEGALGALIRGAQRGGHGRGAA